MFRIAYMKYIIVFVLFYTCIPYKISKKKAIEIAKNKSFSLFGKSVESKLPFTATLQNDLVWHVKGFLDSSKWQINENNDTIFVVVKGGVPHVFIDRRTGKVLRIYHAK